MISQTARYGLHILGHLVAHRGELVRGEAISQATGIPANYLSKILNQLRKSGFVDSQKGWHGGFAVRDSALEWPIRDVLASIDGADSVDRTDCVFGLPECDDSNPCPLHPYWESIRDNYQAMVSNTTVADLATGSR
jgi:Rrf2 family protein